MTAVQATPAWLAIAAYSRNLLGRSLARVCEAAKSDGAVVGPVIGSKALVDMEMQELGGGRREHAAPVVRAAAACGESCVCRRLTGLPAWFAQ